MGVKLFVLQLGMIVYLEGDLSKLIVDPIDVGGDGAEIRVLGFLVVDHDEVVVRYVLIRRASHCDGMSQ